MAFVTVGVDSWTTVVTTTADTVFENRGARPMFLTTESSNPSSTRDGKVLAPGDSIVYGTGLTVKASTVGATAQIYYSVLG